MILGIDLGTTYSVGAFVNNNGDPEVAINSEGERLTPSVVLVEGKQYCVGNAAKENCMIQPENVISTVKNHIGKKNKFKVSAGTEFTPEEISSLIIKKVVKDSCENIREKIDKVVVTVPAYFTDAQRKATEDAVTLAGVKLMAMINEPTAAALYFAHRNKLEKANILVYDLGGGTFDVTVMRLDGNNIEVKSTGGLSNVGGYFFDRYIVDHVCSQIAEKYGINLKEDEYREVYQDICIKAEKAKIQLSNKTNSFITVWFGDIKENITISRDFLEAKIKSLYIRTESKMKEAIRNSGMRVEDIDRVLLVGGSSKIPYISSRIEAFLGKKPSKEINPDESVALGAALYGNMLERDKKDTKLNFNDVCSHSIGIVVIDKKTKKQENFIIIPRNSAIPVSSTQKFCTYCQNQRMIEITITEGEFKELTDVTTIGTYEVELPPGMEQGALVELTTSLDEDQMVHLYLNIPSANLKKEYQMERKANLSEEELKMLSGIYRDIEVK